MDSKEFRRTTEKMALVAGILQPLMTLPQVFKIYSTQSAIGVSLATWLGYAILGLVFLFYGIAHNLKPIWITQIIWFFLQISVVVGVIIYG